MSGSRMREVSVVLGLVLMVMLGAIVVVFVSQPPLDAAFPPRSPTSVAGSFTPGPGVSPTASPTPVPATATGQPTPTGGEPSPIASPSDPPTPAAAEREIEFVDLGLDTTDVGGEEPLARYFTVTVDGPGRIEATLSDVSFGRVRMCLWRGDPADVRDNECQTARRGSLRRDIAEAGQSTWTVSLIGSQAGASPTAQLRLRWPTNDARIHISGFRFQGSEIENYNGFVAEVALAFDGFIDVAAAFDDTAGGAYPYRLIVEEVGGGPAQAAIVEGEGSQMASSTEATGQRRYRITLENRMPVADQRVLVSADINWP